jgi:hypothetical protein
MTHPKYVLEDILKTMGLPNNFMDDFGKKKRPQQANPFATTTNWSFTPPEPHRAGQYNFGDKVWVWQDGGYALEATIFSAVPAPGDNENEIGIQYCHSNESTFIDRSIVQHA